VASALKRNWEVAFPEPDLEASLAAGSSSGAAAGLRLDLLRERMVTVC
jgi:hypothetical protein